MKKKYIYLIMILISILLETSCNRSQQEKSYVKKIELNQETIAVGIYKATGVDYVNIDFISEALKIDGGIVYVTLNDEDVLKSNLDNIDVVLFPEMKNTKDFKALDDDVVEIFKSFIIKNGKGAIGISNGIALLTSSKDRQSLDLVQVRVLDSISKHQEGLVKFELTDEGENIFPELKGLNSLFINYNQGPVIDFANTLNETCKLVASKPDGESLLPLFISAKNGNGNVFLCLAHPEATPGMRWMIPRMVRLVYGKEFIRYDKNVFRPEIYTNEVLLSDELKSKMESLISQLETGDKDAKLMAMDELQKIYPWIAAENVKDLLHEKNDEIKLKAAQFLVDIEYTSAIDDLKIAIRKERKRKVKDKLYNFQMQLENMLEQNK